MAINKLPASIFQIIGIELEYMIVDKSTLNISPIADEVLHAIAGDFVNEIQSKPIAISNELALHVIEFKTNPPAETLSGLSHLFHRSIIQMSATLDDYNAQLMPAGAHPWLNPRSAIALWPHDNQEIYAAYHRIFNCSGHGWGNLQSTHINFPFANEEEFVRLHSAIRIVLAIIPALCASTPIVDAKPSGLFDTRLQYYGTNQKKIPIIAGDIIPEPVGSIQEYRDKILEPMYKAMKPYDSDGILCHEWLNSRGAIARFDRDAIEIRVMDIQESPVMDMACVSLILALLQLLCEYESEYLRSFETTTLSQLYRECIKCGIDTHINDIAYLQLFKMKKQATVRELLKHSFEILAENIPSEYHFAIEHIIQFGNLSERILKRLQNTPNVPLNRVYLELCEKLYENTYFD